MVKLEEGKVYLYEGMRVVALEPTKEDGRTQERFIYPSIEDGDRIMEKAETLRGNIKLTKNDEIKFKIASRVLTTIYWEHNYHAERVPSYPYLREIFEEGIDEWVNKNKLIANLQ
ncbi:hypothetical protein K9L16_02900 [Candidatus Pacearchaeota archaeon]|nr:hypothetical protein [Candidatus Pacearchaeota archaeon]